MIQVEGLTHTYGKGTPFERNALEEVRLSVAKGEFLGLMGHTGSGKSTLIQHLNGLLRPTAGKIYIDGQDIWAKPAQIRQVRFAVGLVFQYPEYQLFEETVAKDIAFGPRNMGLSEEEIDRRVRQAAEFVGLPESVLEQSPFALSGGQRRRVAIAGVIAMEPKVLILDEPTAGLDPGGREEILQNIRRYHQSTGSTILLVSHSMDELARYAERICVLKGGRILLDGTPQAVFSQAEKLTAAGLDVPQATKIAMGLRQRGIAIDPSIYTVAQLHEAILALGKGGCSC